MIALALASGLAGIAFVWLFGLVSNQPAIAAAKRGVHAALLELRVYSDEPALLPRTLLSLLRANARWIALMLVPAAVIAVPAALLFVWLDAAFGRAPLSVGKEAIVTAEMRDALDPSAPPPVLEAPAGIAVEGPPVRIAAERQVSWRIRPRAAVSGELRLLVAGQEFEKHVDAGKRGWIVAERRSRSLAGWLMHPGEARIGAGPVESIDVSYPSAGAGWIFWFLVFSMAAALAVRRRLGVVF